jgi:hypothetical protein
LLLLAAGGAAFGFIGLVIIVPLASILRELFWYADRRLRGASTTEALKLSHYGRAHGAEIGQLEAEQTGVRSWDGEAIAAGPASEVADSGSEAAVEPEPRASERPTEEPRSEATPS